MKSHTGQNTIEGLYKEISESYRGLETTKVFGELWAFLLNKKKHLHLVDSIEDSIRKRAAFEWGDKTRCEFNREKRIIFVYKPGISKTLAYKYPSSEDSE